MGWSHGRLVMYQDVMQMQKYTLFGLAAAYFHENQGGGGGGRPETCRGLKGGDFYTLKHGCNAQPFRLWSTFRR